MLAWYILFGTCGVAVGTIVTGEVVQSLQTEQRWAPVDSYRVVFWAYAVMGLVNFALSLLLSTRSETQRMTHTDNLPANDETRPLLSENAINVDEAETKPYEPLSFLKSLLPSLSRESQSLVFKLCLLFAIDSIASGLTPASLVTYFFNGKFHLKEGNLGVLFFTTNVLSSASNLVASSIARRIGLIKTMVLTHVPASIALALIPLPSHVGIAMALLIFRASTNSMDQAPRQAFLAAAVLPSERTAVMGIVNVVKTLSQSLGPVVTGALAGRDKFWIAFVVAGGLKLVYDILMLGMFLGYRTQEERAEEQVNVTVEAEQEHGTDDARDTPA
jgi:MFS family permease